MDPAETEAYNNATFHNFAVAELTALAERLNQKHEECLAQLASGDRNVLDTSSMSVGLPDDLPGKLEAKKVFKEDEGKLWQNWQAASPSMQTVQSEGDELNWGTMTSNSLLADLRTLRNSFNEGRESWLRINVISGASLRDADTFFGQGESDPYCTCQIRNKPHTYFSTQFVADNLNPVWNHQSAIFDFDDDDVLEFVVKDKDPIKPDDTLGVAFLLLRDFLPHKFEGTLPLEGGQGMIKVAIEIETDDPRPAMTLVENSRKNWPLTSLSSTPSSWGARISNQIHHMPSNLTLFNTRPFFNRKFVTFRPNARSRLLWALCGTFIVMYDFATLPVMAVFELEETSWLIYATLFIASFWTLDMVSTFFTGYEHGGIVERRFSIIARRYFKTWFLMDLSLVTVDWFYLISSFLADSKSSSARLFRLVKIVRSLRTLRMLGLFHMWKLSGVLNEYTHILQSPKAAAALQLCEALGVLVALSHVLACIWYGLGAWGEPGTATWVRKERLETKPFPYQYSTSLHWVLTQFTPASMSVQPVNSYERIFTVCLNLLGIIIFSTFVSTITQKTSQLREFRKQYNQEMKDVNQFLKENQISFELSMRLLHLVMKGRTPSMRISFSMVKAFNTLPMNLKRELRIEIHAPHLLTHGFFKRLHKIRGDMCQTLADEHATTKSCLEGHEIFQLGHKASIMYFTLRGQYIYSKRGTRVELDVPGWVGEPGLWVEGWLYRGSLMPGRRGDFMELEISSCVDTLQRSGNPVLESYVRHYASRFVRRLGFRDDTIKYRASLRASEVDTKLSSDAAIMNLYSDLWGNWHDINVISSAAFREATRQEQGRTTTFSQSTLDSPRFPSVTLRHAPSMDPMVNSDDPAAFEGAETNVMKNVVTQNEVDIQKSYVIDDAGTCPAEIRATFFPDTFLSDDPTSFRTTMV